MKVNLKKLCYLLAGVAALTGGESFAKDLPIEIGEQIFSYLNPRERFINRLANTAIENSSPRSFKRRFERIEKLLELDKFISLRDMPNHPSPTDVISHIGVSQELWFEVMGNNPSYFKEAKYCPDGPGKHKFGTVYKRDGSIRKVPMCPDLPVEQVKAQNDYQQNSDEEFIDQLSTVFRLVGKNISFRRATRQEWIWADTSGGKAARSANDSNLWKYATYAEISDKAPLDLGQPSPSGKNQPHGVKAKEANFFGFKRSGVLEWTADTTASERIFVGDSWYRIREFILEDNNGWFPYCTDSYVGTARLVMTIQR